MINGLHFLKVSYFRGKRSMLPSKGSYVSSPHGHHISCSHIAPLARDHLTVIMTVSVSLCILWTVALNCEGTNHEQISEGLSNEGTSIAASLRTAASRIVVISLENHLITSLEGGETYLHHGSSPMPAKVMVKPHTREAIVMTAGNGLAGVTGIVSYRVADSEKSYRFAIVFSVPFNSWFHNNWFGIALIRDSRPVNEDLYNELYNHEAWHEQSRTAQFGYAKKGDIVTITKGSSEITATMSDDARSVIRVIIKRRQ